MKKGLTNTLLAVAVALVGSNAMSMAPTIRELPDVIVGNAEAGTGSSVFVFPDAYDIDTFATDDNVTSAAQILWSYDTTGNVSPATYRINDEDPITGPADANNSAFDLTVGEDDPASVDGLLNTLTFRNTAYTPITGSPTATAPGAAGVIAAATATATMYASDGTTNSSRGFFIYSQVGPDALSGGDPFETVQDYDFTTGVQGWVSFNDLPSLSGPATYPTTGGICVDIQNGINLLGWTNELPSGTLTLTELPLVANNVYRARITASTNAADGAQPAWSFLYENGNQLYGGDTMFHDNLGSPGAGANSIKDRGLTGFEVYFAPIGFQTAQWAALSAAPAAELAFRMKLRTLDVDGANYNAESDVGRICWTGVELSRAPYSAGATGATPYNVTALEQGTTDTPGNGWSVNQVLSTASPSFAGGNLTLTPPGGGWSDAYIEVRPGDTGDGAIDLGSAASLNLLLDNYPVVWTANTLFEINFNMFAPSPTDAAAPPDFLILGADMFSNEIISTHYQTSLYGSLGHPGLPNDGAAQKYVAYFYSNSVTEAPQSQLQRWRPRMDVGSLQTFTQSGTGGNTTGAIVIDSVVVKEVTF